MKRLLLLWVLIVVGFGSWGQGWRTVSLNDTNYYSAGKHNYYWDAPLSLFPNYRRTPKPLGPDTSMLRMMYVRSHSLSGADTVYHFFRTFRDTALISPTMNPPCADTAAASWLGYRCIRNTLTGTEYYFNKYGDSITINTLSNLRDSWTLARDTSGTRFIGTVIQTGMLTVDGVLDSFKTIAIQGYAGSVPINSLYNRLILQISKNHGWLKTLDLYRFPNNDWGADYGGIALDSNQHIRLPKALLRQDLTMIDLAWRYAPGNEWIFLRDQNASPVSSAWYDSVIAFQQLSSSVAIVTLKSTHFDQHIKYLPNAAPVDTITLVNWIHTDTVRSNTGIPLSRTVESNYLSALHDRYFIHSFDSLKYFIKRADIVPHNFSFFSSPSCLLYPKLASLGITYTTFDSYLPGFGQTESHYYKTEFQNDYTYWRYSYIKIGSSSWGTKVNVSKLGVPSSSLWAAKCSIVPNPAKGRVVVSCSMQKSKAVLHVSNALGQQVMNIELGTPNTTISTEELPNGMYFFEVVGDGWRQVEKVMVMH